MRTLAFILVILSFGSPALAQSLGVDRFPKSDWPLGDAPTRSLALPHHKSAMQPAAQTWDPNIASLGNSPDGWSVHCFAQDDTNLYIAGDFRDFDSVLCDFLVHYNRITKVWDALDDGPHNTVNAMVLHKGILYVGGRFGTAGLARQTVNYITMWDGTGWQSMAGGMNNQVNALAFVGDTLFAGGNFSQAGGNVAYGLAKWDGSQWSEAAGGVSYPVSTLYATHDSLFVGGDFNYVGSETNTTGLYVRGIALLRHGDWSQLGNGYYCNAITMFQGKLWAGGGYYSSDLLVNGLASWDGGGWTAYGQDTLVGTASTGDVLGFYPYGDSLFVLGNFSQMAGVQTNGIAVYHNGIWSDVKGGIYGYGFAATRFDGKFYVGGTFTKAGTISTQAIATVSSSGWAPVAQSLYPYLGWQTDQVLAITTNDRYVFIGGLFTTIAGQTCNHVAAWDKQTLQWMPMGSGVDGEVFSLALSGNDLIVGGSFNHAGNVAARHIARCNITTKVWSAMGDGAHRYVGAIAVNQGAVYATIFQDREDNKLVDYIGKWDGSQWQPYGDGLISGYVNALTFMDTTLYAGGSFERSASGVTLNYVAQLIGYFWNPLNGGADSYVNALAPSKGILYAGGYFTNIDAMPATALAAWDGSSWNPIGDGFDGPVLALARDGHGGVYAGGFFRTVAGSGRGRLVHWNGSSFGTVASGVDNDVESLGIDGQALYVGGWFESAGASSTESLHFAALEGAGAGVAEAAKNSGVSLFPNPTSGLATVRMDASAEQPISVEVLNTMGERVLSVDPRKSQSQDISIDARSLASGSYFLRLVTEHGAQMLPMVIER